MVLAMYKLWNKLQIFFAEGFQFLTLLFFSDLSMSKTVTVTLFALILTAAGYFSYFAKSD